MIWPKNSFYWSGVMSAFGRVQMAEAPQRARVPRLGRPLLKVFLGRVGLFARVINARRLAGLKIESTAPSALAEVMLRMTLIDATGLERFEIAAWNRCEIDRGEVEALAAAIRRTMQWTDES